MHAPRMSIGLGSFLVALALVVAVGIGSAIAVIPNNGTYYACLTKRTGALKVINYPKKRCPSGTRLIKWNAKGPAGPQGVQGPQGPKGDQGPAGPADWNAIPNIPAGFKDGVDDGTFVSEIKVQSVSSTNFAVGFASSWIISLDRSVDIDCYAIPVSGTAVFEVIHRAGVSESGTEVRHTFVVNATTAGPGEVRLRCRSYSQGIAPAALKKQLQNAKVTIRKAKGVMVR